MDANGRWRAWARRLWTFLLGQGATQALGLLTGLLLVRWLSAESFAQYSVAFGFQSTVGILTDLGVSGCLIALAGPGGTDPATIGRYIRSARHYRVRLFIAVVPVAAGVFFWLTARQGWGFALTAGLFGSVVCALWFQGPAGYYAAPLLSHGRLGPYYRVQVGSAVGRLGAVLGLAGGGWLGATSLAWVNSLASAYVARGYARLAAPLVRQPERADPAANREMLRYLSPVLPGIVFYALQGQLTLLLITAYGQTQNVAEVAALGRLTQVLVLLGAFNGVVLDPLFARLPLARLPGPYALVLAAGLVIGGVLVVASYLFPAAMLLLIGPKYAHLRAEVPWSLMAWAVNYLGGLLWTIHSARKWVFLWHTAFLIVTLSAVQAVGVWTLDLSTTRGIFMFAIWTGVANLLVHAVGGIAGYRRERRLTLAAAATATHTPPALAAVSP